MERIAKDFDAACSEPFTDHPLAAFIRNEFRQKIAEVVGLDKKIYKFTASPGKGKWAEVPWGAVFNPLVTETAQSGFYIVYLFSKGGSRIYLSLIQGGTEVREEYKSKVDYLRVLKRHSSLMREKLPEFHGIFPDFSINLDSDADRPVF